MDYKALSTSITRVFIDSNKYIFDKYVPTFKADGMFLGDAFNFVIVEPRGDKPPVFYHTFSPYDVISKKAPDRAMVFEAGEMLLNIDFAQHVKERTGVMTPLLLQTLNIDASQKKILFVGAGKVAQCALAALKALNPELQTVDYINRSTAPEFIALAKKLGVTANVVTLENLASYDVIICHTSSKTAVLTAELHSTIKKGALIATFVSEDHVEVDASYFDTNDANVIVDWAQTMVEAPELKEAIHNNIADSNQVLELKHVLAQKAHIDLSKKYTIYRSHGTPMQNLAVLKLLLKK